MFSSSCWGQFSQINRYKKSRQVSYAQNYYLRDRRKKTLHETVAAWREYMPDFLPLPHPSWRNTGWLKKNPWFEEELVPELRRHVKRLVT